jgi:hypothetical protein
VDEAVLHIRRLTIDPGASLVLLQDLADKESVSSLVRENCGALAIGLAERAGPTEMRNMSFPEDALRARSLTRATICSSYFQGTSLVGATLQDCRFIDCSFERLEIGEGDTFSSALEDCTVSMVVRLDKDEQVFDPVQIRTLLERVGLRSDTAQQVPLDLAHAEPEEGLVLVERSLRLFLRANQVNEDVIRTKLGVKASLFFDDVLPDLIRAGVVEQIPYLGHGSQRRFKLGVHMERLHAALSECSGDYQQFLNLVAGA